MMIAVPRFLSPCSTIIFLCLFFQTTTTHFSLSLFLSPLFQPLVVRKSRKPRKKEAMTSSVMNSQSTVFLTTAMAVSGAVILLSLCRIRNLPSINPDSDSQSSNQIPNSLRSCLSSGDGKREKKKKKRVSFADNVVVNKKSDCEKKIKKDEIFKKEKVPEFRRMPANRAALYHGILRDRVHRTQCSY